MAVTESSRIVTFALLCFLPALLGQSYKIPEVSIVALKPRGVEISIPDDPGIKFFSFQGSINRHIRDGDIGDISAWVMSPHDGLWKYRDNYIRLKVGDVINYYVDVTRDDQEYHKSYLKHTIRELFDPNQATAPTAYGIQIPTIATIATPAPAPSSSCAATSTSVISAGLAKSVCSGQIIFEDNFDTLREDLWTIEQYIPSKPEYPFVSYQRPPNSPTVSVANGILRIEPKLQETFPGFDSDVVRYGTLDLSSGCTQSGSCVFTSEGSQILPSIASGRITSKTFAFKYGVIEVRARVPQGDWLYPDILLESLLKKYGSDNYNSGVLRIAGVLGNMVLNKGAENYGNKVLYGGPIMNFKCRTNLLIRKISTTEWGNDFHVYSLRWAPEIITLLVDGEEWGRVEPPASGLQTRLPRDTCDPPRTFLKDPLAPFDDYFNIIFGLSAGGVSEFPDGVTLLNMIPKPWKNTERKARLKFLNAKDTWLPTWTQPALLIDYVKVRAL